MIPEFLEIFKSELEKYKLETVKITAIPISDEILSLTQSKFLGKPYLPINFEYPKDRNNRPMNLWAQINFAEIPSLENYPTSGILQFFISSTDWYDMSDYKIIFHKNISENYQTEFSFLTDELYEDSPIYKEHKLNFKKEMEFGGYEDFRFDFLFNGKDFWDYRETLTENEKRLLDEIIDGSGHKIGGYAYFTQGDIRDNNKNLRNNLLLLQIDTDEQIMFGDSGVANFFISPVDLKNQNFENVFFYWDCC